MDLICEGPLIKPERKLLEEAKNPSIKDIHKQLTSAMKTLRQQRPGEDPDSVGKEPAIAFGPYL